MLTLYISVYSDSGCIQRGRGTTMKKIAWSAAASAALVVLSAGAASAADMDSMVTKAAPMAYTPTPPASCGSFNDFILTACPLTWNGITLYGTVDMGVTYATHGVPFDPNHPTGELYVVGAGGTVADNRLSGFFPGENAMSQSNIGVKINEPIAPGWNFVSQNELAFNPYSGLLATHRQPSLTPSVCRRTSGRSRTTRAGGAGWRRRIMSALVHRLLER